jgi:hypothetical protein
LLGFSSLNFSLKIQISKKIHIVIYLLQKNNFKRMEFLIKRPFISNIFEEVFINPKIEFWGVT